MCAAGCTTTISSSFLSASETAAVWILTVCIFSIAVVVYWLPVLHQEPQSSEEDPGETLKRTIKAQRQRQRNRVHLPLAPSFFQFHLKQFNSAHLNTLNSICAHNCSISCHISGAWTVFSSGVPWWWCGGDLHHSAPQWRWRISSKGSWHCGFVKTPNGFSEKLVSMFSQN